MTAREGGEGGGLGSGEASRFYSRGEKVGGGLLGATGARVSMAGDSRQRCPSKCQGLGMATHVR